MTSYADAKQPGLSDEIRACLPDAEPDQVQRFTEQVRRLQGTREFFARYAEHRPGFETLLARAEKALNYKRPYHIAIIGVSAAGKSTLINALLGNEFAPVGHLGGAVTGTTMQIFFNDQKAGTAEVVYRDEANIRSLIERYLIEQYGIDASQLPPTLDESFSRSVRSLQVNPQLRHALADMVDQYNKFLRGRAEPPRAAFALADPEDEALLRGLISEKEQSNPPTSLVRFVRYYVRSSHESGQPAIVNLPANVCLVDLPGAGGQPLHDIVIKDGIREADAVVFVVLPRRGEEKDEAILSEVRKYVSLGTVESTERVFLVINKWDAIPIDDPLQHPDFARFTQDLTRLIAPGPSPMLPTRAGEQPYFLTSAALALTAQRALRGEPVDQPDTYEAMARKLRVRLPDTLQPEHHREVLEASQVPQLIRELNRFARESRIEGQIREGRFALDQIVGALSETFERNRKDLTGDQGESFVRYQETEQLGRRQAAVERLFIEFLSICMQQREQLQQQLAQQAHDICREINAWLQSQMPTLWQAHFTSSHYLRHALQVGGARLEQFLGEVEMQLWSQLASRLRRLSQHLVLTYTQTLEDQRIVELVRSQCYNHPLCEEMLFWLQRQLGGDSSDSMRTNLTRLSERIALIDLLDPKRSFLPADYFRTPNPPKNQLLTALAQVPNRETIAPEDFQAFVQAVAQHYEPFVRERSVGALLNIYEYEMLVIHQQMRSRINQLFNDLRSLDDPVLRARIREDIPNLNQVELLGSKLELLALLRSSPASAKAAATQVPEAR